MSQRSTLARTLFESLSFSSAANQRTWRTVVAAGAMIGSAYLAAPVAADPALAAPRVVQAPPAKGATVNFEKTELDAGIVRVGARKTVEFAFTNTSQRAVKIDAKMITSSCKCLVAVPPKTAVPPGGKGVIKAVFTAPNTPGPTSQGLTLQLDDAQTVLAVKSTIAKARPRRNGPGGTGRGFILS